MSYWMAVRRRLAAAALAAIDIAALAIAYTGNMTDEIVTMGDGRQYRLLTLTSSGTLSIAAEVKADVWLCGGGANGGNGSYPNDHSGGGGGYVNSASRQSIKNVVAVVGAAAGASSFGSITANGGNGKNGGSGGGGAQGYDGGTGAGVTTYPFGDTTYFTGKPHCAGGGGGATANYSESRDDAGKDPWAVGDGGAGGSNGGNGTAGDAQRYYWPDSDYGKGGGGGSYGGGHGGDTDYRTGTTYSVNGTFYGSGGGGAVDVNDSYSKTGVGYQGVIYVRIPLKPLTINDFQLAEYLESTGTQYINTGINPTQNTKMELDVAFLGSSGTNVAGVRNTSADTTNRFGIISFGSANKLGAFFGAASVQGAAFDQARHSYALDSSALIMDGTSYAVTSGGTFACTYPITLGAWNNGANGVECNSARIYACKLHDNGTLVRDFVPCYRKSDNVPGLWDKVENRFFMNAGSGSFTVGQNV